MSTYKDSLETQRRSFEEMRGWLSGSFCDDGRYVLTDKGRLSAEMQQRFGDMVIQRNGEMVWVEMKAEEKFTGNFFIEDWSNWSRGNPGWIHKLDTDLLFYHFLDQNALYMVHFHELRAWLFSANDYNNRMSNYRLVRQKKCDQKNDTWGRLVPIRDVMESTEVRSKVIYLGVEVSERIPAIGAVQQSLWGASQ